MDELRYHPVEPIDREEAEAAFRSHDARAISEAIIRSVYFDPDWRWVQDRCLEFAQQADSSVRWTAIAELGTLARFHRRLDLDRVIPVLRKFEGDPHLGSAVEEAFGDFEVLISPQPTNGAFVLDGSIPIKSDIAGSRRVGVDREFGQIVVFDEGEHGSGAYHGYITDWRRVPRAARRALAAAEMATLRGRLLSSRHPRVRSLSYVYIERIRRSEAEAALRSGAPDVVSDALIRSVYHDPDWRWVQDRCLEALPHPNEGIRRTAVMCLGYVAQFRESLDLTAVLPALRALRADPAVAERLRNAEEDLAFLIARILQKSGPG